MGFVEAEVCREGQTVLMQWTRDSAFRFFPLVQHPELAYQSRELLRIHTDVPVPFDIEAPHGAFHLHPGSTPMICIAASVRPEGLGVRSSSSSIWRR